MANPETSVCYQHGTVRAEYACQACGKTICKVCAFPHGASTGYQCPECASANTPASAPPQNQTPRPPKVEKPEPGVNCFHHPNVEAVYLCNKCKTPVCDTCDFTFPGDRHYCPKCAENNEIEISPRRKTNMIWSYVCAVAGLALFILFFVWASSIQSESDLEIFSMIFGTLLIAVSAAGMALGFSALDKRLGNTMSMWIATVWNMVILGSLILLCIIGLFTG